MGKGLKFLKGSVATIITLLLLLVIFAIIFVKLEWATPGVTFYSELCIITVLCFVIRNHWYNQMEYKRLHSEDMIAKRKDFFDNVDIIVQDTNDFENYLSLLDKENRDDYVRYKMGNRTVKSLSKKTKLLCLLRPSFRKLEPSEIGEIRYEELFFKYSRKSIKIKPIKIEQFISLSDSKIKYDTTDYRKSHKQWYQIISAITSVGCTIVLASLAFEEIILNWTNCFRYCAYLFTIISTATMSGFKAWRVTEEDTVDLYDRLTGILMKYRDNKEVSNNGIQSSNS